jgi:hypothetical protein
VACMALQVTGSPIPTDSVSTGMGKGFCPPAGLRVGEGWGCGYSFGQANAIPALVRLAAITSYHKGILLWSSNL